MSASEELTIQPAAAQVMRMLLEWIVDVRAKDNYRHWGDPQQDRDYEVIESAYGYSDVIAAALKRLTKP